MADQKVRVTYTLLDKASKGIRGIGKSVLGTTASFLSSKFGLLALGAAAIAAIKDFAKFETAMVNVGNLTNASTEEINKMSQDVIALGRTIPQSTQSLAESLFDVVSAGVPAAESIAFLEEAAKLATAGVTDTKTAVDGLTSVMNAFGFAASDVTDISDKFFAAQVAGKTTIEELSNAIGNVAPIAAAAGVSIDELLSAVASLTVQGIRTNQAVTGLRGAIAAITQPTEQAKEVAELLGIEFNQQALEAQGLTDFLKNLISVTGGNTEALGKLLGRVEAVNAVIALSSGNFEKLDQTLAKVQDSAGLTEQAFEKQGQTIAAQATLTFNAIKELSNAVVSFVAPAVNDTLRLISNVFKAASFVIRIFRKSIGNLPQEVESALDEQTQIAEQKAIEVETIQKKALETRVKNERDAASQRTQIILKEADLKKKLIQEEKESLLSLRELSQLPDIPENILQEREDLEKTRLDKKVQNQRDATGIIRGLNSSLGAQQLSIQESVAKGSLGFIKKQVIAFGDARAAQLLTEGAAESPLALIGNPSGFLKLAAAAAISAGIRGAVGAIQLQDGGIIPATPGGVPFIAGERGQDEAVIPLDELRRGGGGGPTEVIILSDDGSELAKGVFARTTELLNRGEIQDRIAV